MTHLFTQFSGLVGVLVFLHQLWDYAPFERALLTACGAAMAIYLVLIIGHVAVRHILDYTPPRLAEEAAGGAPREDGESPNPAAASPTGQAATT